MITTPVIIELHPDQNIEVRRFWIDPCEEKVEPCFIAKNPQLLPPDSPMAKFAFLEDNWDHEGAEKLSHLALRRAHDFYNDFVKNVPGSVIDIYPGPNNYMVFTCTSQAGARLDIWLYGSLLFKADWEIDNGSISNGVSNSPDALQSVLQQFRKSA